MKDFPSLTWLTRYRERLNADPELKTRVPLTG
jgi:hypothetical protein